MAMNNDFALITLSQPVLSDVGFLKLASSTGAFTLNLTTAGYPVRSLCLFHTILDAALVLSFIWRNAVAREAFVPCNIGR